MNKPFAAVDTETYYDDECSVKPLGTVAYTLHPKFDCYMVSIYCPEYQYVGDPCKADWEKIRNHSWISHNAGFDMAVYQWLQKQRGMVQKLKGLYPKEWHCTSALSVFLGAPRDLGKAAKFLLNKEVSKGMRSWMKEKTWGEVLKMGLSDKFPDRTPADLMLEYAMHDAVLCYEIWEKYQHHWPENERLLSRLTYDQGAHGIHLNKTLLEKNIRSIREVNHNAELKIPWVKDGEKPTSPKALNIYCSKAGIPAPVTTNEDDDRYLQWEEKYGDKYDWVKNMRAWRKSNTILKRLSTMQRRLQPSGCMSYSLKYFGGHTGRWSGDEGFNVQNQHNEASFGINIRNLITPRTGKKFVICDLAQIEPRVLAWACDDVALLDSVRKGFPIYEAHARGTMNWKGGKLKDEDPRLYKLAKARVLGLGYGCGAEKFITVARTMADLELSLEEAQMTVAQFRNSNPKILGFWNQIEMAFKRASLHKEGEPKIFYMNLPNGREMRYLNVSITNGSRAQVTMGGLQKFFWGGKLTENYVQATARDVFAEGLLELHRNKIEVAFHTHDEFICEVPKNFDKNEIVGLVTKVPSWLEGCPLAAEAKDADYYTK